MAIPDDQQAVTFKIEWIDRGRDPQCPPDPDFPDGKDIPAMLPGPSCGVKLPYPAKRCGVYIIECSVCGIRVAITTVGRRDDPRSVSINCRPTQH